MKTLLRAHQALLTLSTLAALLCFAPLAAQAQYEYVTNNGTITITRYIGPGGDVSIPSTIDGLPVTTIGYHAFMECFNLNSVTIPNSLTRIGASAFERCTSLTSVMIGNGVTLIGDLAFATCTNLTAITVDPLNLVYCSADGVLFDKSKTTLITCPGGKTGSYIIPNSVTSIGDCAFRLCSSLTNVTIPASVQTIKDWAFLYCTKLTRAYFKGNAPYWGWVTIFAYDPDVFVLYLPGTTGWGTTYGDRPTAPWYLPNPVILTLPPYFGVRTNRFGFIISWATNASVAVEACTNLANPTWSPVGTNILTDGWSYFSDPEWTNYPARFYRLRSP